MITLNEERFRSKISTVSDKNGCLLWTAGTNAHGYGAFRCYENGNYVVRLSHRLAYMLHTSQMDLPSDVCILHSCDNPSCCNVEHLREGTQKDNVNDRTSRSRNGHTGPPISEVCRRGHDLTVTSNIRIGTHGRQCRLCFNIANQKYYKRKKLNYVHKI